MNPKTLYLLGLSTFGLLAGCNPSQEQPKVSTTGNTAPQLEQVKKETKEAAQALSEYAYAQKTQFVEQMQRQLNELNRDVDQLAVKIEKSSAAAKADAEPKIKALRDKASQLNQKLEEAKGATESTWDDVKSGFRKGYNELKEGFQEARQWVSDKIAP